MTATSQECRLAGTRPDYGIDSPAIIAAQSAIGLLAFALALVNPSVFGFHLRLAAVLAGTYFLYGAWGILPLQPRR
jgi:hypothetical protein